MTQVKAPFRKLKWKDNTTDLGKKAGYVEFIGEIYQSERHHQPFITYYISNNFGGKLNNKLQSTNDGLFIGEFETLFGAKNACQKHLEETIIKTFFEL
jgi:hypothetical protein